MRIMGVLKLLCSMALLMLVAFTACQAGVALPEECDLSNGRLSVTLEENPSTGYSWHYVIEDEGVLSLVKENPIGGQSGGMVGAPNEHVWTFKGIGGGESRIEFKYYREWEGGGASVDSRSYLVVVDEAGRIKSCRGL